MTTKTTESTATETTTEATSAPEVTTTPSLTTEQEINALRAAHQFFSNFDRVPGFLTNQWSKALDTIAVVANSLIGKANLGATTSETTEVTAESADTTVTQ